MNRVIMIGNLAQDPEMKYTQSGQAQLKLRLAVNETYLDKSGERKERTEFVSCVLWGKRAEALNKLLSKGKQIAIEGRMETRSWEDKKSGDKRYATEVVVTELKLLGRREEGQREQAGGRGWEGGAEGAGAVDDDIAFGPLRGEV